MNRSKTEVLGRSYLFVPGNRPDRFSNAMESEADYIIFDLEDAVSRCEKHKAREDVAKYASNRDKAIVRVNSTQSPWFEDDIRMLKESGLAKVVLPKCEGPDVIEYVSQILLEPNIYPLIETALGFSRLSDITMATGVKRLMFGSIDFCNDLSVCNDYTELTYFRSKIIFQSRLANLPQPIDGITSTIYDKDVIAKEALLAKRAGFGAKLAIHPAQVPLINATFIPTPKEVEWAEEIVSSSDAGATQVRGEMVDRAVVNKATRILDLYGMYKGRGRFDDE